MADFLHLQSKRERPTLIRSTYKVLRINIIKKIP